MWTKNKSGWRTRTLRTEDSARIKPWLMDRSSLTGRLQAMGDFSVILLKQRLAAPTKDEARELHLKRKQLVWIREVTLLCDHQPVVFAHTILPRRPRGPLTRWLARLSNRSLGALLFSHPRFQRGPLMARRIDTRHPLFLSAIEAFGLTDRSPPALWARRSRFSFGEQSVLVTEIFSPTFPK